jgi:hypothetical protein
VEPGYLRVLFEDGLDNLSLDPDPTAMDDPHLLKAPFHCLIEVFLHHDPDFSRLKIVQIDRVLNRDLVHSIQYNGRL